MEARARDFAPKRENGMKPRDTLRLAGMTLALWLAALPARAQAPADTVRRSPLTGNSATLLRGGPMGELLAVYVPRLETEVQRLLEDARELERWAMDEVESTRRLALDADGRARIMREEIQTTRVRWDVARAAKDAAALAALDAAHKRQVRERTYLEQLRDALRADADRIEADRSAATARVKALELELLVARKNLDLSGPVASPAAVAQYRALLRQMLDAQQAAAIRARDAADRHRLVAERKLRQLETLNRLSVPETPRR
jgi:hypothetical protein